MTRVLVTGAGGFIGRAAVVRLRECGFDVVANSADLFDRDAMRRFVASARATHLLHLAWYAKPGSFWTAAENLRWVGASLDLFAAFAEAGGTAAVGAGSCAEYRWDGTPCVAGATSLDAATLYGRAKAAVWSVGERFFGERGVRFAWGRIFFVYGLGEPREKLVSSLLDAAVRGEPADLREPERALDFIHVDDVARAFAVLLSSPEAAGAYNLGSGVGMPVRVAAEAAGASLRPPVSSTQALDVVADISTMSALGWSPTIDLKTGITTMRAQREEQPG